MCAWQACASRTGPAAQCAGPRRRSRRSAAQHGTAHLAHDLAVDDRLIAGRNGAGVGEDGDVGVKLPVGSMEGTGMGQMDSRRSKMGICRCRTTPVGSMEGTGTGHVATWHAAERLALLPRRRRLLPPAATCCRLLLAVRPPPRRPRQPCPSPLPPSLPPSPGRLGRRGGIHQHHALANLLARQGERGGAAGATSRS